MRSSMMPPAMIRAAQRLAPLFDRRRLPLTSLIPKGAQALDRRQCDSLRRSARQLMRHGAWEQAWALIELSTEVHRYNPTFHRSSEKLRKKLSRRLHAHPSGDQPAIQPVALPALDRPFRQLSDCCEDALIHVDPQAIRHWGCVVFPGIVRGRFHGHPRLRFCNAVLEDRYLFRGLSLADDPQVQIFRRRLEQGLSWKWWFSPFR